MCVAATFRITKIATVVVGALYETTDKWQSLYLWMNDIVCVCVVLMLHGGPGGCSNSSFSEIEMLPIEWH